MTPRCNVPFASPHAIRRPDRVTPQTESSWVETLNVPALRQMVSRRTLEHAISSDYRYVIAPALAPYVAGGGAGGEGQLMVRATMRDDARREDGRREDSDSQPIAVELHPFNGRSTLTGECSRDMQAFGACVHVTLLALDLANCTPLRTAVRTRTLSKDAAEEARGARRLLAAEQAFDLALLAWTAKGAKVQAVEIAAAPVTPEERERPLGRTYGDRPEPTAGGPVLSLSVRRAGERKLLTPRELMNLSDFAPRDRAILEHARDRNSGRKALYATELRATLALDAMRRHGGVFTAGFKSLLDFRRGQVRPHVAFETRTETDPSSLDALSASWIVEATGTRIAFEDAVFFPAPFASIWSTVDGSIYRVAPDVDLAFVAELTRQPRLKVPVGRLKDAGAQLLRAARGRGIELPSSESFGLPPRETPRFVLRLSGEPLAIEAELVALYKGQTKEVVLLGADAASDARSVEDGRDLEEEAAAREEVIAAGLLPPREEDVDIDEPATVIVSGEDAVAFWTSGLLRLRNADRPPIEVELSKRLATVRVGSPLTSRVHVTMEGNWLAAKLDFTSHDLPVEIDEVRAALKRKDRWVTLSDGTLSRISTAVEALVDEAAEIMPDGEATRLAPHQLGRLDRWIEENDGQMDTAVLELRKRLRSLAVATDPAMPRILNTELRSYQKLGLSWLQFLRELGAGGILADDMGLGKTVMALAFLQEWKERSGPAPSLVVCPTSVATNWVREAAKFTPDLRIHLLYGPDRSSRVSQTADGAVPTELTSSDLLITTYALLRRDAEALSAIRFRVAILDEAQMVKNADTEARRAAGRLDAEMHLALSGTPIENRLRELWSLASYANPGILGTIKSFETRFERPLATDRASPAAAELRAVIRPFLLRRTKDDVLQDLPPKTEIDKFVTLTPADKRKYDALAHTLRASVAKDLEAKGPGHHSLSVFAALTRLRQMACDPALIDASLATGRSAKREIFLELVEELVAEGRRALVFSQFVKLLTLWRAELDAKGIAYEYLDGSTTHRDRAVDRFQNGTAPLFLVSLKAGGSGLNLTAADTVIHCDPWWNPAVEDQATDRAHRIGQTKPVTVVRLIARGTIEEKILALEAKKRDLVDQVISSDAGALTGLTTEDVQRLLGDAEDVDEDDEPVAISQPAPELSIRP